MQPHAASQVATKMGALALVIVCVLHVASDFTCLAVISGQTQVHTAAAINKANDPTGHVDYGTAISAGAGWMNNNKRLSATTSAYATIATTNADTEDDSAVDINSSAFFVGTDRSLGLAESTQHRDLSAAHSNMLGKRVDTPTNRDSSSTSGGCGHSHSRALSKSDTGLESNQAATTTPNEPWRPESLSGEYVDDNFLAEFSINNEVDADDDADDNDSSENDDDNSNSNEDNNNDVDIHNDDNDDDDDEYESEDDDGTNDDDNNNGDSLNNNNNNASQDVVDRRVETRHDIEADSNRLRFERTSYEALVREDGRAVEMTPPIAVLGGEVCDIKIVPHVLASQASLASKGVSYHEALMHAQTFDVTWIDRVNGHAILEAKSELDCETQRVYHLNLVAIGCDGRHSKPVNVRVNVADVNEFGPQFMVNNNNNDSSFNVDAVQLVYVPAVSASVVGVPIAQLPRPVDHDCSAPNNQICRFQVVQLSAAIENADLMMQHNPRRFNRMLHQQKHDDEQQQQPMDKSRVSRQFGVDQDAKLYVRRKLVPGVRHELAIYAFDCAGRRSPWPANVTVFVMPLAPYKAANNTTTATTVSRVNMQLHYTDGSKTDRLDNRNSDSKLTCHDSENGMVNSMHHRESEKNNNQSDSITANATIDVPALRDGLRKHNLLDIDTDLGSQIELIRSIPEHDSANSNAPYDKIISTPLHLQMNYAPSTITASRHAPTSAGHFLVGLLIACGLLISVVMLIGISELRSRSPRRDKDCRDLALNKKSDENNVTWDESFTITVNPLDNVNAFVDSLSNYKTTSSDSADDELVTRSQTNSNDNGSVYDCHDEEIDDIDTRAIHHCRHHAAKNVCVRHAAHGYGTIVSACSNLDHNDDYSETGDSEDMDGSSYSEDDDSEDSLEHNHHYHHEHSVCPYHNATDSGDRCYSAVTNR